MMHLGSNRGTVAIGGGAKGSGAKGWNRRSGEGACRYVWTVMRVTAVRRKGRRGFYAMARDCVRAWRMRWSRRGGLGGGAARVYPPTRATTCLLLRGSVSGSRDPALAPPPRCVLHLLGSSRVALGGNVASLRAPCPRGALACLPLRRDTRITLLSMIRGGRVPSSPAECSSAAHCLTPLPSGLW